MDDNAYLVVGHLLNVQELYQLELRELTGDKEFILDGRSRRILTTCKCCEFIFLSILGLKEAMLSLPSLVSSIMSSKVEVG